MITLEQYQDVRKLICSYREQTHTYKKINYGITFKMYLQARQTAEAYEDQRYTQENTGCPYFIDWSKPEGKTDTYYFHSTEEI
jgi:hypothetical protein